MEQMMISLKTVLEKNPDLGAFGFERGPSDELPAVGQFERAVKWLALMPRRASVNRDFDSYGLKHCAETWGGAYVGNGALIAAALHLGFIVEATGRNALINAAARSKWPVRAEVKS